MESTWYNSREQNFQPSVLPACALNPWCNLNAVLPWTVTKREPAPGASLWYPVSLYVAALLFILIVAVSTQGLVDKQRQT